MFPVRLPDECWVDVLLTLSRPLLGFRVALVSRRFDALSNSVICCQQHTRKVPPLALFCDQIGWIHQGEQFIEKPIPIRPPPKNLQIQTISVYCMGCLCNERAVQFLRLLTRCIPCCVQLEATDPFRLRNFGRPEIAAIIAQAHRIRLNTHPDLGGISLISTMFDDQKLESVRNNLLKVPILECQLLSESDFPSLFNYIHHTHQQGNLSSSSRKQLLLFCEDEAKYLINAFIRLALQIFATALEPCQFSVQFLLENGDSGLLFLSVPPFVQYNLDTGEELRLSVGKQFEDHRRGRKIQLSLERIANRIRNNAIFTLPEVMNEATAVKRRFWEQNKPKECLINFK